MVEKTFPPRPSFQISANITESYLLLIGEEVRSRSRSLDFVFYIDGRRLASSWRGRRFTCFLFLLFPRISFLRGFTVVQNFKLVPPPFGDLEVGN
jgi:hypothetical protein